MPNRPTIDDGHTCPVPTRKTDKKWFTCPLCGQLWRLYDGFWKLTPREAP